MRRCVILILVLLTLASQAIAGLVRIGTLPTPDGTTEISGLEVTPSGLFAVADLVDSSALYLIDRETGAVLDQAIVADSINVCPEAPRRFVSCAFENDVSSFYWVGDRCGALIKYYWQAGYVETVAYFVPEEYAIPEGLVFEDGYLYMLDALMSRIMKVDPISGDVLETVNIEQSILLPSALALHNGDFFVVGGGPDSLYQLDNYGHPVNSYCLEGLDDAQVKGLTFFGDTIYVAVPDSQIFIYSFDSYGEDVPEGDSVVVEVVPDEVSVTFDSVVVAGTLYVDVLDEQPCVPPDGVTFLSTYYEMATSASFDYIAQVTLLTEGALPGRVEAKDLRVFVRPSGECETWRDITVAPAEEIDLPSMRPFRTLMRTQSEEDEFSVFALAVDKRNPGSVAEIKFGYLEEALASHESDIPSDTYQELVALLNQAHIAFSLKRFMRAIHLIERFVEVVEETPEIPHTYDPEGAGVNVAGKLISRAHTLEFTLSLLVQSRAISESTVGEKATPTAPTSQANLSLAVHPSSPAGQVEITFTGARTVPVTVSIFSVEGRLVRMLLKDGSVSNAQTLVWDRRDASGRLVAPGTYFVVARQGSRSATAKIVVR